MPESWTCTLSSCFPCNRTAGGGRRVTIHAEPDGTAYSLFDVLDCLHVRACLPAREDLAVDDPELIEWRGGGPYAWNGTT